MLMRFLLVVLTLSGLAALFLVLRPDNTGVEESPAVAAPDAPEAFRYRIAGAQVEGPDVARVAQNSRVLLEVRSDADDELHLHGYDISRELPAGQTVTLTFIADKAGRFSLELHGQHRRIGALEVAPR